MDLKIKKYLYDIQESIDSIEKFLVNKRDFRIYVADKMLRRAVEREFEIIGEAMTQIEKLDLTLKISGKRQIISRGAGLATRLMLIAPTVTSNLKKYHSSIVITI